MKYTKYFFLLLLLIPCMVLAEEAKEELNVVGSAIKYYKTVSVINNSEVVYAIIPEVTSITTEITEEEYNNVNLEELNEQNAFASVETTYKILKTTVSESGNFYRYRVDLTWKNIPKVRSYDIIAFGHYSDVVRNGNYYFREDYCRGNGDCSVNSLYTYYEGKSGQGAVFVVPDGTLTYLTQSFYADMKKKSSSTTITVQAVIGDYAHATKTITKANALKYTVDLNGINHDSSVASYYDTIGSADVILTGKW